MGINQRLREAFSRRDLTRQVRFYVVLVRILIEAAKTPKILRRQGDDIHAVLGNYFIVLFVI